MATVGDLSECPGELKIEWRIKNFSQLNQDVDVKYCSPKFYYVGSSWNICFCANGESYNKSDGWTALYVNKASTGPPVTLDVSISIKTKDDKRYFEGNFSHVFDKKDISYGFRKYLHRSNLMAKEFDLIPSDILTIIFIFKADNTIEVAGSLFSRFKELSEDMRELLKQAKNTDVVLQTKGQKNICAHRIILEKRSSYFGAMFCHDFKETQTGEIYIDDTEKRTMKCILEYLYTGDIGNLTTKNALSIYAAAEKYDVKVVKEMCSEYIRRNLTEDWVCDVVKLLKLYDDKDIFLSVREYIKTNSRDILKTEKWKALAKENGELIFELFGSALASLHPE